MNDQKISTVNPYGKTNKAVLKPLEFDKLIFDQGIRVLHEKTSLCPNCFDREKDHTDITCTLCDNGRIHFDPREVWVLFLQKSAEQQAQLQGLWNPGDVSITFPSKYENKDLVRVDFFDRITLIDFSERTTDLVKRTSAEVDKIRYPVTEVILLRTKDKIYNVETDFVISNGNIKWISSNKPLMGEIYTLCYLYRPQYRIVNFFHEQRYYYDQFKSPSRNPTYLPVQAQARRDFIQEAKKGYD